MTYALSDFRTRFPELAGFEDPQVQALVDEAELQIKEEIWDDLFKLGIGYYVAHNLIISKNQAQGDANPSLPVTGMNAGNVGVQMQKGNTSDQSEIFFQSTSYGQQYLRLRNIVGTRIGQTGQYVNSI